MQKAKIIFILLIIFSINKNIFAKDIAQKKTVPPTTDLTVVGEGGGELNLSQFPLPGEPYNDDDTYMKNFQPEKNLLSLLDTPEVLLSIEEQENAIKIQH